MYTRVAILACGWALLITPFLAAPAQRDEPAAFKVDVNLVVVHATVEDGRGRIVSGLTRENFRLLEDGGPREIARFSAEDAPVTVGLVVDSSGSMLNKRSEALAGALGFAAASHPDDEIFVVHFSDRVGYGLPPEKPFTDSAGELRAAFARFAPSGKTALYDALVVALGHLKRGSHDKKVLLVISDGGDNASKASLKQVLDLADRSGAIIYAIGIFDELSDHTNPGALRRLARLTGGKSYFPETADAVREICLQIAHDIRNQYMLAYASGHGGGDAKYHRIEVSASHPEHRKLRVRARQGYYADDAPR
ncbi:MAG: VWA domain-containing protein [Bryobacteraceae bacterium]|nr:VWA domain-containing protein [Bryobacteraceae bacterium]